MPLKYMPLPALFFHLALWQYIITDLSVLLEKSHGWWLSKFFILSYRFFINLYSLNLSSFDILLLPFLSSIHYLLIFQTSLASQIFLQLHLIEKFVLSIRFIDYHCVYIPRPCKLMPLLIPRNLFTSARMSGFSE